LQHQPERTSLLGMKGMLKLLLSLILLCSSLSVSAMDDFSCAADTVQQDSVKKKKAFTVAGEDMTTEGTILKKGKENIWKKLWNTIVYLTTVKRGKVDVNYVDVNKYQWKLVLNTFYSDMDISLQTPTINASQAFSDRLNGLLPAGTDIGRLKLDASSNVNTRVGLYLGYGGVGLGYYFDLSHGLNSTFTFNFYKPSFGFDIRLRKTNKMTGSFDLSGRDAMENTIKTNLDKVEDADKRTVYTKEFTNMRNILNRMAEIDEGDIDVHTLLITAYYAFNKRKFSYSAATWPDMIQKRSAGSWLLYSSLFYARFKTNDNDYIRTLGGINRFSSTNLSLGGGYGYNWVLCNQHLLLHGSVTPMLMWAMRGKIDVAEGYILNDEKNNYARSISDKYLGGKSSLALAGVGRGAVMYRINPRFTLGVDGVFTFFRLGKKDMFNMHIEDYYVHGYFAFQF